MSGLGGRFAGRSIADIQANPQIRRGPWFPEHCGAVMHPTEAWHEETRIYRCPLCGEAIATEQQAAADRLYHFATTPPVEPEQIPGYVWTGTHYESLATEEDREEACARVVRKGHAAARAMRRRGEW